MQRAQHVPSEIQSQGSTPSPGLVLTTREFFWLTLAVWIGGIFILTLLPYVLVPRMGGPMAIAASYLVFFLAWQPVQSVTQRTLGVKAAFVRMIIFVTGAATLAAFFRQSLPSITG
jgi:hypothetical protein